MRNKKRITGRPAETPKLQDCLKTPELGTKEAAFKTCVGMIASMCGKPVDTVQYWLDLYFQVRLAYAVEEQQLRRDAQLINRIPQIFCTPKREEPDAEQAAPAPEAKAEGEAAAEPPPHGAGW